MGLGHVSRSVSVALALGEHLGEFVVIGDEHGLRFASEFIPGAILVADESSLRSHIDGREAGFVIDMTEMGRQAFEMLQSRGPVFSISPIFPHQHEVALSFSRTQEESDPVLASDPQRHLRGPEYAVLGPHVRRLSPGEYAAAAYARPLNVGVAMGGSDAANMTMRAVRAITRVEVPVVVWAMLGEGYGHSYDLLVQEIQRGGRHEVLLAKSGRSMWTVLSQVGLLILAGGVTSYEAAFAGIPAINITTDRNSFLVDDIQTAGAAVTLMDGPGWDVLPQLITRMESDRDELFWMHRKAEGFVDDEGASRIVDTVLGRLNS